MMFTKKGGGAGTTNGDAVAAIKRQIEETRQAALEALAEAERLEQAGGIELDDDRSEDLLRQARAQRRAARRAEIRLDELRNELAATTFERDRAIAARHIAEARRLGRELIAAVEVAGEAVARYAQNRDQAIAKIGGAAEQLIPILTFIGILYPPQVGQWRRMVECEQAALDRAELRRPPSPPAPRAPGEPLPPLPTIPISHRASGLRGGAGVPGEPPPRRSPPRPVAAGSPRIVSLSDVQPPPPPRDRQVDDLAPLMPGEVRVRASAGYSPAPDRPQCDGGQLIRMPADDARQALAAGAAIEIIEEANAIDEAAE